MTHVAMQCVNHAPGWRVEWFDDETERVAYWYGSRAECDERAKAEPPADGWVQISDLERPPHDAATARGDYDP